MSDIFSHLSPGVASLPLALWDVDNDGIEDLLIGVSQLSNDSQVSSSQVVSKGNHTRDLLTFDHFRYSQAKSDTVHRL